MTAKKKAEKRVDPFRRSQPPFLSNPKNIHTRIEAGTLDGVDQIAKSNNWSRPTTVRLAIEEFVKANGIEVGNGRVAPEPPVDSRGKTALIVRMSPELRGHLDTKAMETHQSRTTIMRLALESYLGVPDEQQPAETASDRRSMIRARR